MFGHLKRMAFFDEAAIPDRVYYLGGYSALESGGLRPTLMDAVEQATRRSQELGALALSRLKKP